MNFWKLMNRAKGYISMVILISLCLIAFHSLVIKKESLAKVDYTIRDYSIRTLNQENFGTWSKLDNSNIDLFEATAGDVEFTLEGDKDTIADSLFQKGFDLLTLRLHEKVEISSTNATIRLSNGSFEPKIDALSFPPQEVEVRTVKANDFFAVKKCRLQGQVKLLWNFKHRRYMEHVFLDSDDCDEFNLIISSELLSASLKAYQVFLHGLMSLMMISLMIYSLVRLEIQLQNDGRANRELSTSSVLILGTIHLVLGFEQLVLSLFDFPYFITMIVIGIIFFNIFFFLVLKTVSSTVRYQLMERMRNDPDFSIRSYLLTVYCRAHLTILGTFFISLKYIDSPCLFYIWALGLLPQIYNSANSKSRFLASKSPITLFYLLTMCYALYMHFFKSNFFSIDSDPGAFSSFQALKILFVIFGIILIILLQEVIHPAFFLPKKWRVGGGFEYFFDLDDLRNGQWKSHIDETCIICFSRLNRSSGTKKPNPCGHNKEPIDTNSDGNEPKMDFETFVKQSEVNPNDDLNFPEIHDVNPMMANSTDQRPDSEIDIEAQTDMQMGENTNDAPLMEDYSVTDDNEPTNWKDCIHNEALKEYLEEQPEENKFMATPCKHVFHTACLLVWMARKMECPMCRTALPTID